MNPVCPDNCAHDLPAVGYNSCLPKVQQSQLRRLFIGKANAAAFDNWKLAAEWNTRIDQTSTTGNDYIRVLTVTGEKPAPANITKKIDNGILIQIAKDHTINFTTYQVTDENYEFMRGSECGILVRLFAFETMGGAFFGSNEGILVSLVMDDVLAGGDDDLETITGQVTWRSKFSPERISLSPIFDVDYNLNYIGSSFNTTQTFAVSDSVTSEGVTTTLAAVDPDAKFEFNSIATPAGAPTTMTLKVGVTTEASVDFPADYLGAAFRFTDTAGGVHTGVFTDGTVTF